MYYLHQSLITQSVYSWEFVSEICEASMRVCNDYLKFTLSKTSFIVKVYECNLKT